MYALLYRHCSQVSSVAKTPNRVRAGFEPALPTPPGMRVRTGLFMNRTHTISLMRSREPSSKNHVTAALLALVRRVKAGVRTHSHRLVPMIHVCHR